MAAITEEVVRRTVAGRVKEARERTRLTQRELAQLLGVASTTVSNWENEVSGLGAEEIVAISRVTGMPPGWFFGAESVAYVQADPRDVLQERFPDAPETSMVVKMIDHLFKTRSVKIASHTPLTSDSSSTHFLSYTPYFSAS